jgi:hypothetical protein
VNEHAPALGRTERCRAGQGNESSACKTRRVKDAFRNWIFGNTLPRIAGEAREVQRCRRHASDMRRQNHVRSRARRTDDRAVTAALIRAAVLLLVGALRGAVVLRELGDPRRRAAHHEGEHERDQLQKPRHQHRLYVRFRWPAMRKSPTAGRFHGSPSGLAAHLRQIAASPGSGRDAASAFGVRSHHGRRCRAPQSRTLDGAAVRWRSFPSSAEGPIGVRREVAGVALRAGRSAHGRTRGQAGR